MDANEITKIFQRLPKKGQAEVSAFMDAVSKKYMTPSRPKGKFHFDWEGKLHSEMTAVELQHEASKWR